MASWFLAAASWLPAAMSLQAIPRHGVAALCYGGVMATPRLAGVVKLRLRGEASLPRGFGAIPPCVVRV